MAAYRQVLFSAGRELVGATVTVYNEDSGVVGGNEDSGFTDADKATIYSDAAMATAASNPLTSDSTGSVEFYAPTGSQVALKVEKAGYGKKWIRYEDVTGSDLA